MAAAGGPTTRPVPDAVVAQALTANGVLAWIQGNTTRARELHEARLALSRRIGDESGVGKARYDLANVAYTDGDRRRAIALLEEALVIRRRFGETRGVASVINRLGTVSRELGRPELARDRGEESLRLYQEVEDVWGIADALHLLCKVVLDRGDYPRATLLAEETIAVARQLGHTWTVAATFSLLAEIELARGNVGDAAMYCREGMAIADKIGYRQKLSALARAAGLVALATHDLAQARQSLAESLAWSRRLGDAWDLALTYSAFGRVDFALGDIPRALGGYREALTHFAACEVRIGLPDAVEGLAACLAPDDPRRASRYLGAAAALRIHLAMPLPPADRDAVERVRTDIRIRIGARAAAASFRAGHRLSREELLAEVLADGAISQPPAHGDQPLSPREREVARLIAQGATNRAIAQTLGIAERTADAHVRSILRKLNLTSRAEVVAALNP